MKSRSPQRRGVLLLVCLVVLIFFLLTGLTFVLVASQWREGAENAASSGQEFDANWQGDLQDVAFGLIRGEQNVRSPFKNDNLLRDLYGSDGVVGAIAEINSGVTMEKKADGQFLKVHVTPRGGHSFRQIKGHYNGCVLSIVSGPSAPESFRIVNYLYSNGQGLFIVAPTDSDAKYDSNGRVAPNEDDVVVINGRPFNGTGLGYDPETGLPSEARGALEPNLVYSRFLNSPLHGGLDEDYDIADYNNPWLATVLPNGFVKPSWHDPALIAYHLGQAADEDNPVISPRIMYRPIKQDFTEDSITYKAHTNFDGGNPGFVYNNSDWNVDSDNDGVPDTHWDIDNDGNGSYDSIWMDYGAPVRRAADGRYYKPLVAMLVIDLDGKVNVNTAGSLDSPLQDSLNDVANLAGTPNANSLLLGRGYGPVEIDLESIVGESALTQVVEGRRGSDQVPGSAGEGRLSALVQTSQFGGAEAYGPLDFTGQATLGLDQMGWPRTISLFDTDDLNDLLIADDAYEQVLDPTLAGNTDAPFTPADLEAVYRNSDSDVSLLPDRLALALSGASAVNGPGSTITTDSWSLPVIYPLPSGQIRANLVNAGQRSLHVTDLLYGRLGDQSSNVNNAIAGNRDEVAGRYLSLDLLGGRPMDINRLFGNGKNDGGPASVDEPSEALLITNEDEDEPTVTMRDEQLYGSSLRALLGDDVGAHFGGAIKVDHNNDGFFDEWDKHARYNYAKQIYILLRMLGGADAYKKMSYAEDLGTGDTADTKRKVLYARRLAQYAVNVVDFRDPDSIMTSFEFDIDPFNDDGWAVDGDPGSVDSSTDRQVVWGCEAPALLLSEIGASHDLRVDDTDVAEKTTDEDDPDPHYDTVGLPLGSLFIELYCPTNRYQGSPGNDDGVWNTADDKRNFPNDLYDDSGLLNLKATHTADGTGNPVWRILISDPHLDESSKSVEDHLISNPDTTTLQPSQINLFNSTSIGIDRMVLFGGSSQLTSDYPGSDVQVFRNTGGGSGESNVYLKSGEYLVIGPRAVTTFGLLAPAEVEGEETPASTEPGLQQIEFTSVGSPSDPNPPGGGGLTVTDTAGNSVVPATTVQTPAVMIATYSHGVDDELPAGDGETISNVGLNVSVPRNGYEGISNVQSDTSKISPAIDEPVDLDSSTPVGALIGSTLSTGTYTDHRTVFLQRLADPTRAWHPQRNPYLTVDFMPIDLTIFNGDARGVTTGETQPNGSQKFGTRQRGGRYHNIWTPAVTIDPLNPANEPDASSSAGSEANFDADFQNTLGYLSSVVGAPSDEVYMGLLADGDGAPGYPFPWLVWNDRPFVSQYELMQVPASSPQRLCWEFSFGNSVANYGGSNSSFGHLLNFFYSNPTDSEATQFHRFFDYVYVPSHFVDSHVVLNASDFQKIDPDDPLGRATALEDPVKDGDVADTAGFHPPFNLLSKYREPGRVNINTIMNASVLTALKGGRTNPSWAEFTASRAGGDGPSYFNNPFRSSGSWDLHPVEAVRNSRNNGGIDVTLLRPGSNGPLFGSPTSTAAHANTSRNSYFAYEAIHRLGNLVTTQSNVYAVWMTLGYFEVSPTEVGEGSPDGYLLGQEMGLDTGDVRRHRAFFIIDRSIPVAYENGIDHNAEKTIRLQRFIE